MRLTRGIVSSIFYGALFKVPTLRNVALTGPHMHDGSMRSLHDVVDHYNIGGKNHPNKSNLVQPLNLTNQEKGQLIAFLQSLKDQQFITEEKFKDR